MVFSTILFLFRFLPITLLLYYLAPGKLKNTVLFKIGRASCRERVCLYV